MENHKHTPGPWLAAAKPSSVVGWPVVATSSGRSIASVTLFSLGSGFENHDRESAANARVIAAAPEMKALCERVAALNEHAGEIGAGMLVQLVTEARAVLAKAEFQ